MGRKLYVGNFPYETGEAELQDLFARAGTVETVKVMRDMATGRPRGFAFVEMGSDDEAQAAAPPGVDGTASRPIRLGAPCPRVAVRSRRDSRDRNCSGAHGGDVTAGPAGRRAGGR